MENFDSFLYDCKYTTLFCLFLETKYKNIGFLLECIKNKDIFNILSEFDLKTINFPNQSNIEELKDEFLLIDMYFKSLVTNKITPTTYYTNIGIDFKSSSRLASTIKKMKDEIKERPKKWKIDL